MKRYLKIGSMWRRDHEKVAAGGKIDIAVPVLLTCEVEVILLKRKDENEKAPDWDIVLVTGEDDGKKETGDRRGNNDDIPF